MTTADIIFLIIAVITLVAAWRVVVSQRLMHAALWLGFSFLGVASAFLMLGADFLAAAQVLIYVGAITVLLIFGIMLSDSDSPDTGRNRPSPVGHGLPWHRGILPLISGAGFAIAMMLVYSGAGWRQPPPASFVQDTPKALGHLLFGKFVIPFEAASLVLLVGLIGAIVLATREEGS